MPRFLPLAALALLAARPAGAVEPGDRYDAEVRFERPGESRTLMSGVALSQSANTVMFSSGAAPENFIVNIMPTGADREGRLNLMYQVEWDWGGSVMQAQDEAELSEREWALLSEQEGKWKLWGRLRPERDLGDCARPGSGGGILVRLGGRAGGEPFSLTRRTVYGVSSNILFQEDDQHALTVSLTVSEEGPGAAKVGYHVEQGSRPSLGSFEGDATVRVKLGVETPLPGTDLRLSVTPLPEADPKPLVVREVPDKATGMLRHQGTVLSFLHLKDWTVKPSCDEAFKTTGWTLIDQSLPEQERIARRVDAYVNPSPIGPLAARTPKEAERFKADGASCALWTLPERALASCDTKAGWSLEVALRLGPDDAKRVKELRRLLGTLRIE